MEHEVRYCTTEDGVRIAYSVEGDGTPLVVMPEFVESLALDHLFPDLQTFMSKLGEGRRLIRFDQRGSGLSQRYVPEATLEAQARDLTAVAEAVGLSRFAIWASGIRGLGALRYAASHPKQVSRLVIYGSYVRPTDAMSKEGILAYAALIRTNFELAMQSFADLAHRQQYPEAGASLGDIFRQSADREVLAKAFEASVTQPGWDMTPELHLIQAPTLVLHRRGDPIFPFEGAQKMAAGIPGGRLVPLEGNIHYPALLDPDAVLQATNEFLDEDPVTRRRLPADQENVEAQGPLRTVLFTDLVGHTEMMSRLGDDRGRDVLREHERITREVLKANGGTEVKTMGDGFMASFGSVTKAVECAVALQRAFAEREGEPLNVRVGLNAGEPIEEDGDLFGATVILASRIAAKAAGGEILVADTVRGLCSGKGFLFADRGEFVAKGFEEPVRVSEVSWRHV